MQTIERPIPPPWDQLAAEAHQQLEQLHQAFLRAAEPYTRLLAECERHRPPPIVILGAHEVPEHLNQRLNEF